MIKRILIVCSVLSTITAIAMENNHHMVTVKNYLTQSTITIKSPVQEIINGETEVYYHTTNINPQEKRHFQLIPENNMSNLQLILASCYDPEFIDIAINQKKEKISIIPHDKNEEILLINNNAQKNIALIKALMKPALYYQAKSLVLERLHTTLQPHHHVTVANHIKKDVSIAYSVNAWTQNPTTFLTLEELVTCEIIEPDTQNLLSILIEEGEARLLFILPDCDSKDIAIYLNENQKNISIIKGDASNDIRIVDENNCQLAWTFTVLNSQSK